MSSGSSSGGGKRMTVKELLRQLKASHGIDSSPANVWKARFVLEYGTWEQYEETFKILPNWMKLYCDNNPGSRGCFLPCTSSSDESFRGAFLANGAILHMVKCCGIRLLGQDYTHISHPWYQGKAMVIEGRLANGTILPVAVVSRPLVSV